MLSLYNKLIILLRLLGLKQILKNQKCYYKYNYNNSYTFTIFALSILLLELIYISVFITLPGFLYWIFWDIGDISTIDDLRLLYSFYSEYNLYNLGFPFSILGDISNIYDLWFFYPLYADKVYNQLSLTIQNLIYNNFSSLVGLHLFSMLWLNFITTTIVAIFYYNYLGLTGFFWVNAFSLVIFWISLILEFNHFVYYGNEYTIILGEFNLINSFYPVAITFLIDKLSYSFAFLTTSIAVFVFFYTFCYFRYEPNVERLVTLLLLFVNSMILLVFSGNLIVLFLGWELIGVTSFFLINFWGARVNTLKSALKALTFNKVSDSFILAGIILAYNIFNSADILLICNSVHIYNSCYINLGFIDIRTLDMVAALFMVAAFIKSAQFGFHLWLPDSMEAPAPASALIHSATLVSAGVFLILRLAPLFETSILATTIIPVIGAVTAFYGGIVSAVQTDVKKILAYSTISHCGFMILLTATFNLDLVLIYLYVHGFFKALLFLCAGSIMRLFKCQDFRYMGVAYKYLPVECVISIFGFWHLSGGPFSFGYVAKHYIITTLTGNSIFTIFLVVNIMLSIIASLIYSSRFIYYIFFDFKKAKKSIYLEHSAVNLFSKNFSLSTYAGSLILCSNYVFVILMCTYILSIWNPISVVSPATFCIDNTITIALAQELPVLGTSITYPIIVINTVAFILFWAILFTNFRKTNYPEQDLNIITFYAYTALLLLPTYYITLVM